MGLNADKIKINFNCPWAPVTGAVPSVKSFHRLREYVFCEVVVSLIESAHF